MPRVDPPASTQGIEALLRSGLDHYGRNEIDEAIARWREVLRLDPKNEQAADFLQTAGYVPDQPDAQILPFSREPSSPRAAPLVLSSHPPAPSDPSSSSRLLSIAPEAPKQLVTPEGDVADAELKNLLIERRFEDALQHLYSLRSKRPRDEGLSRSIQLLREKLADVYSDQLVHLDRVPRLTSAAERHAFSSDERQIASLVDGISSFGDIVQASKLGRVPSLRILCQLQQSNLLTSSSSSIAAPRRVGPIPGASSKTQTPPSANQPQSQAKPASGTRVPAVGGLPVPSSRRVSPDLAPPSVAEAPAPSDMRAKAGPASTSEAIPRSTERTTPGKTDADSAYEARFAQATHYYLLRDFDRAVELFRVCEAERPGDPRPRHNLKAILNRTGKP
jgi:tetratricopeptide (TPR) repeat protein